MPLAVQHNAAKVAREWTAAGVGCALADTVFNPLEVLKVRAQQATTPTSTVALARAATNTQGFIYGLFLPGLCATWMRGLSYTGFRIGLYPSVRDFALSATGSNASDRGNLGARLCAGAITGGTGALVFNPIDVVRVRMQASRCAYPSTARAFGQVARQEGVLAGLWGGSGACVLRATMLSGAQLATYDASKRWLLREGYFAEDAAPLHFSSSFVSGVVAQTVAMPADTLKTLAMSSPGGDGKGMRAIARRVLVKYGWRGFYKGYLAAAARQGPVMVLQMPLVEALRNIFGLEYF